MEQKLKNNKHAWILCTLIALVLSGCFWSIKGNSGINPNDNFLGTKDNQALILKTNNNQATHIGANGNISIGSSTATEKLSVSGTIESTSGGIKFPDGTIQTTAANISNLSVVTRTSSVTVSASTCCRTASVQCNPGEVATGGGFVRADDPSLELFRSRPVSNGWTASMTNYGSASRTLHVYVVCLSLQ